MSVNWNQNGNWLLTASRDHLIKVYDIRAMKEMYTLKGHKKDVNSKGNGDASFDNQFFISKTVWSCSQTLFWVWNWTTWYISFPGFQYLIYSFQYTNMEGEGDIVMSGKHKHGGGGEILWCQVNTNMEGESLGDIVMSGKHKVHTQEGNFWELWKVRFSWKKAFTKC